MQSEISPAKGLNMKLGPSLLMLAIAGSVVPDAAAGQKARPDPVAHGPVAHAKTAERVLGVCGVIDNEARGEIYPNNIDFYAPVEAEMYLRDYEQRNDITQEDEVAAKTTILIQPKHGTLIEDSTLRGSYRYTPNTDYVGKDSAEVLVEIKGMKVKVHYFIHATEYNEPNAYEDYCEQRGGQWKISQDPNGNRKPSPGGRSEAQPGVLPFAAPIKGARLDLILPNRSHLN